ncbi:Glyoxalase/Bleomycin resistance protein/Dihydroxybiphenyl dioxygenase [Cadophora sp. MPI-SDFR-AT-0126]|nr:Glyoxalase/Bleomycin resistance protein/Dihydroxybiphenyl dioxygenase [Leotiomycetes sp. MPI-SDFR-AT-0126]
MGQASKINVLRLGFVHYKHPDLERINKFLEDFGLIKVSQQGSRIYYCGYGVDPYIYIAEQSPSGTREFVRAAWVVKSAQDLELATAEANASPIQTNDSPGGGQIVNIKDPSNFTVSFIYGQELREKEVQASVARHTTEKSSNEAFTKQRHGDFRRFNKGPSLVHKLGHYGLIVPKGKFREVYDFYISLINLKPSDGVYDPATGEDKTCFIHIDHGAEHTDHHSFFIGWQDESKPAFVHHSSFEVNDYDTQSLGHDWLQSQGWINCWGIGRHVLGSQIFDYW